LFTTTISGTWLEIIPLINVLVVSFISPVTASESELEDFMKSTVMSLPDCMLCDVQGRNLILTS
jgi:hypothetical protein